MFYNMHPSGGHLAFDENETSLKKVKKILQNYGSQLAAIWR